VFYFTRKCLLAIAPYLVGKKRKTPGLTMRCVLVCETHRLANLLKRAPTFIYISESYCMCPREHNLPVSMTYWLSCEEKNRPNQWCKRQWGSLTVVYSWTKTV